MADELRRRLPELLENHRLHQAWAYKYTYGRAGINVRFFVPLSVVCSPRTYCNADALLPPTRFTQIRYTPRSCVHVCSLRVFVALFVDGGCVLCLVSCVLRVALLVRSRGDAVLPRHQAALNVNCWYVGVVSCVLLSAVLCWRCLCYCDSASSRCCVCGTMCSLRVQAGTGRAQP